MKNYIVLHTHWDREWYFTTSDSLVLMDRTFKNVINELKLYPQLSFCLDGQYSIIEEFLGINPELESQVKELVQDRRLQIGPWHTQTDTQLVAEEAIVRNLYYGMNRTIQRFGKVMEVGYLPDTFGFCHQMPEIYNLARIDKAVFWRGADFSDGTKPYFNWQGAGGSTVKTINLFGGYGMAKGFSADHNFVEQTLKTIIGNYKQLGIDGELVIPVGNDQFEIKTDIPGTINQIKTEYNLNLEVLDYGKSIDKIFEANNFDTYTCEFRKTTYTRLHKSIGSVRYDLKKANYEAEQLLINEVEPLFVIAKQFDIKPSINLLYSAWSLLFEGQAHDGICGCISDDVYDDMVNRIKRAKEIGNSLKNLIIKQITIALGVKNSEVVLINTSPTPQQTHQIKVYSQYLSVGVKGCKSQLLDTEVIHSREDALVETPTGNIYEHLDEMYIHNLVVKTKLEPYEIKILELDEIGVGQELNTKDSAIGNGLVAVKVVSNQINVSINNIEYKDVIKIVDIANDGDTYDFSPLKDDQEIEYNITNSKIIQSGIKNEIEIMLESFIPFQLSDRIEMTNLVATEIKLVITMFEGDDKLHFKLHAENKTLSHKLSVRINLGSQVIKTVSSSAYGEIVRNVVLNQDIDEWEQSNVEKPVSIETFDGFVKSQNNDLVIISSFGKEYQAHNQNIDLTVFATTKELGKSDLLHRPGRASGDVTKKGHILIDTPKAQCLGSVEFEFALTTAQTDYFTIMSKVQAYRTKAVSYQVQDINKFEGRIDNKLMEYRESTKADFEYNRLTFETNGYVTSVGIGLNGQTIIRGVANDNHQFVTTQNTKSIDLLSRYRSEKFQKFQIFNYELEGE